jgi:hypothetical protein
MFESSRIAGYSRLGLALLVSGLRGRFDRRDGFLDGDTIAHAALCEILDGFPQPDASRMHAVGFRLLRCLIHVYPLKAKFAGNLA